MVITTDMEESPTDTHTSIDTARRIFENYLKTNRMRKTPERFAVLESICETQAAFTVEDIYRDVMERKKFQISLSTIYNTMDIIEKAHLVVRHQVNWKGDPRLMHYQKCLSEDSRHHFVCKECGDTFDIADDALANAIEKQKKAGFHAENYVLFIYGTCARCYARKMKRKKNRDKNK
jgi:Fur family ferric uptake transcriptional regulator